MLEETRKYIDESITVNFLLNDEFSYWNYLGKEKFYALSKTNTPDLF